MFVGHFEGTHKEIFVRSGEGIDERIYDQTFGKIFGEIPEILLESLEDVLKVTIQKILKESMEDFSKNTSRAL